MSNITCPKCNSDQISAQKKGFSGVKAVGGALVAGPIGAFAGTHGSGNIKIHCMACGFSWKPKEYDSLVKKKEMNDRIDEEGKKRQDEVILKSKIRELYQEGKKDEAEKLYLSRFSYDPWYPNIDAVYKKLKKEDTNFKIGLFVVACLIIILFVWMCS